MSFRQQLLLAKEADDDSVMALIETYKPLLVRQSTLQDRFDEDLFQILILTLLKCIQGFHFSYLSEFSIDKKEVALYNGK